MDTFISSLEPPSKCACHVECHYADVNVPSNKELILYVEKTVQYLRAQGLEFPEVELAIIIVDEIEIEQLNTEYRQQPKATNVLSFPFETPELFLPHQQVKILGDVFICAPIIEIEAQQQNKKLTEHWAHMLVHGVLHLFGFDHENSDDAEKMEDLEINILNTFGYKNPYMERL